jgi:DNA (cytosine-5)-methyltransferase 1
MQGFPASFKFPVSDIAAMKQLGNSVAVSAIYDWAKEVIYSLENPRG